MGGTFPLTVPVWGANFSVKHACSLMPRDNFLQSGITRFANVGNWMAEICKDVDIKFTLQPITGKVLKGASVITEDGARLYIAMSGFWGDHFYVPSYFDVSFFNLCAPSIDSNPSPLPTRELRPGSMNSIFQKWSIALHSLCDVLVRRSGQCCKSWSVLYVSWEIRPALQAAAAP